MQIQNSLKRVSEDVSFTGNSTQTEPKGLTQYSINKFKLF